MKFKSILLSLSIFAIFAISFDASAKKAKSKKMSNSENAKMILKKARDNVTGKGDIKSFTANYIKKCNGKVFKNLSYCSFNPDGTTFLYNESCNFDRKKEKNREFIDFLINDSGEWYILNKFAIKLGFHVKYRYSIIPQLISEDNKYSIKTVKNKKGMEAYLITEKINSKNNTHIALIQYSIRKKNMFPYSILEYGKNGKLMIEYMYKDIQINIPIENNLFKINDKLEIKIAKDLNESSYWLTFHAKDMYEDNHKLNENQKKTLDKLFNKTFKKEY